MLKSRSTTNTPAGNTHVLKIGFNKRWQSNGKWRNGMGRLRGFVVFHDREQDGTKPVDIALTTALIQSLVRHCPDHRAACVAAAARLKIVLRQDGEVPILTAAYTEALLNEHFAKELKMPDFELPSRVEFLLCGAAKKKANGEWDFPSTFDSQRSLFRIGKCPSGFCSGNGETASRWQPDGTRRTVPCNPFRSVGVPPEDWCKFSLPATKESPVIVEVAGEQIKLEATPCQGKGWMVLWIGVRDERNRLVPLSRIEGARYLVTTGSERGYELIGKVMKEAADRLDGDVGGIPGMLVFAMKNRAKPHHVGGGVSPNQQLFFSLSELEISRREELRRLAISGSTSESLRIEGSVVRPAPRHVALLTSEPAEIEGHGNDDGEDNDPTFEDDGIDHSAPLLDDRDGPASTEPQDVEVEEEAITIETATAADMISSLQALASTVAREEQADVRAVIKRLTALEITKDGKTGKFATETLNWFTEGKDDTEGQRRFAILKMVVAKYMTNPRFSLRRLTKEQVA